MTEARGRPVLVHSDARTGVMLGSTQLISHRKNAPFLSVGAGSPHVTSAHGNFRIRPNLSWRRPLDRVDVLEDGRDRVALRFRGPDGIAVTVTIVPDATVPDALRVRIDPDLPVRHTRLWIQLPSERNEPAFGCGEQYSRLNLRGSRVPLWTGEQGVGRGFNLTTLAANLHSGAGGHWHSTYFPQPTYVTASGRFVHAESGSYAAFSFLRDAETLEIWEPGVELVIGAAGSLPEAISRVSLLLGRQPPLPEWTHDGMWLGLQGGARIVREKVAAARAAGIPLSGVWVQDWVGRRVTAFGSQLFWDWHYDAERYPHLPELIRELNSDGIRFLGYINPFLAIEGDLYREARDRGYCIRKPDGSDYLITVTTFPAAMVDLSNPDAWSWLKTVIQENMLDVGLRGWMADYGEYLPEDAVLANGDPMTFHNRYPAEWARLNHEAVKEAGLIDDVAIFMRAGFSGSSRYTHAIWAGDQMVDWSRSDGLPSVIPAALSVGTVGIGVHHSDLGGFTSLFSRKRSRELFMRWAEHSAFTPIMRSHESNRPDDNWQWDSDAATVRHLARMAQIYVALAPYRRSVLAEYSRDGLPAMRPVFLHYPPPSRKRAAPGDAYRYLFGRDLLVQPVLHRGRHRVGTELPDDTWVHLWTGDRFGGGSATVGAELGFPPVFFRAESPFAELFAEIGRTIPEVGHP